MKQVIQIQDLTAEDLRSIITDVIEGKLNQMLPKAVEPEEFMTRKEVATFLRISLTTLGDYTNRGILIGHQIGSRILYLREEVKSCVSKIETIKHKRS